MLRRSLMIATSLTAALAGAGALHAQGEASKAEGWDRVQTCASIAKPSERLRCVDAVIRHPNEAASRSAPPAAAAPAAPVAAQNDAAFGLPPAPRPKAERVETEQKQYVLTRVTEIGPSRYRFVTDSGETWEQLESGRFVIEPSKGARMMVRRSALGGYTCTFGRTTATLCRRLA